MTEIDTDKLRALDEAATPGLLEWDAGIIPPDGPGNYADLYVTDEDREPIILAEFNDNLPEGRGNAKLWCYLRNSVPAILAMADENKRLREALETLTDAWGDEEFNVTAALVNARRALGRDKA